MEARKALPKHEGFGNGRSPCAAGRQRIGSGGVVAGGLAVALAVLAIAPGNALGGSAPAPGVTPGIAWKACGRSLQCARVMVPLDWAHPRGRKISVAVIRHLASRPSQRIGSLFVNPGGPGGSVDQVRNSGAALDAAGEGRFDVVGWDIRGAGESTHVRCFSNQRSAARFFRGWSLPTTKRSSPPYVRIHAIPTARPFRATLLLLREPSTSSAHPAELAVPASRHPRRLVARLFFRGRRLVELDRWCYAKSSAGHRNSRPRQALKHWDEPSGATVWLGPLLVGIGRGAGRDVVYRGWCRK